MRLLTDDERRELVAVLLEASRDDPKGETRVRAAIALLMKEEDTRCRGAGSDDQ